jgi:Flp pilus assembly protein TadG
MAKKSSSKRAARQSGHAFIQTALLLPALILLLLGLMNIATWIHVPIN